jgi:hypothetical protein
MVGKKVSKFRYNCRTRGVLRYFPQKGLLVLHVTNYLTRGRLTAFDRLLFLLELVLEGLDELGTVEILLGLPRVLLWSETLTT